MKESIENFKSFVGIRILPDITVEPFETPFDKEVKNGYGVLATHVFYPLDGRHLLKVRESLFTLNKEVEYILFHELTHAWDTETYAKNDKKGCFSLKGYTEYHAAQIELLRLLCCESILRPRTFSLQEEVKTFAGSETAFDHIRVPYVTAMAILKRSNFPENITNLFDFLGLVFNYLGFLSVCKMYAEDYADYKPILEEMTPVGEFVDKNTFFLLTKLLDGWLDDSRINVIRYEYSQIVGGLVQRYKLV